jgi:hypothetical protein
MEFAHEETRVPRKPAPKSERSGCLTIGLAADRRSGSRDKRLWLTAAWLAELKLRSGRPRRGIGPR